MKAVLCPQAGKLHHRHWLGVLAEGLGVHGIESVWLREGEAFKDPYDFVACWGWASAARIINEKPTLVMECGFLGDRTREWISLGWNGLNGRADFCTHDVPGDRGGQWRDLLKPCRPFAPRAGDYIVIMGQMAGDSAWQGRRPMGFYQWAWSAVRACVDERVGVVFRPHPNGRPSPVAGLPTLIGPLDHVLAEAAGVVTFNSNSGVDAVLAGAPTIACDRGSMVYDLVPDTPPFIAIDEDRRQRWLDRIAYCQWTPAEIADGSAWEHLKRGL